MPASLSILLAAACSEQTGSEFLFMRVVRNQSKQFQKCQNPPFVFTISYKIWFFGSGELRELSKTAVLDQ
jgi:hypothetical protein